MIKRILIPLDPSEYCRTALKYGKFLAHHHDAELAGMTILDEPGISKSVGPVPAGGSAFAKEMRQKHEQQAVEKLDLLLEDFKKQCSDENINHKILKRQGDPADIIHAESFYFDMVVTGLRTFFSFESDDKPGNTLDKMLDHSITPILALPEEMSLPETPSKIVIAHDGSIPSARAMHQFARSFLPKDCEIILLNSSSDMEKGHKCLDCAEVYLRSHEFNNIKKEWSPQNINQIVDEKYYDSTDIFVIGLHAKKGILDFFIGSLSRHLIQKAEKALFIGA